MAISCGELRSFREFSKAMTETGLLKGLSKARLQILLHELYRVAQTTKKLDRLAERLRAKIPDYRDLRERAKKASGLLRRALGNIRKAVEAGEKLLFVTVSKKGEPCVVYRAQQNFQDVEDTLNFFIEDLDRFRQSAPALIPPEMRRPAEKKLVAQVGEDRHDPHLAVPMSERTAAIGHWFIHEAHALLWKYRRTDNREVPIINELFRAAFGMIVTADYVRKTIARQRKKRKGRKLAEQMQIAISLAEHYFDGGPITVTLRPPRRTKSRALSTKALK